MRKQDFMDKPPGEGNGQRVLNKEQYFSSQVSWSGQAQYMVRFTVLMHEVAVKDNETPQQSLQIVTKTLTESRHDGRIFCKIADDI